MGYTTASRACALSVCRETKELLRNRQQLCMEQASKRPYINCACRPGNRGPMRSRRGGHATPCFRSIKAMPQARACFERLRETACSWTQCCSATGFTSSSRSLPSPSPTLLLRGAGDAPNVRFAGGSVVVPRCFRAFRGLARHVENCAEADRVFHDLSEGFVRSFQRELFDLRTDASKRGEAHRVFAVDRRPARPAVNHLP